jgi:hypothetical protein
MFVIRILGTAKQEYSGPPLYVKSFDPTWRHPSGYPTGSVATTDDLAEAMVFETSADAIAFWRQEDPEVPLRPDGRPNRPLTAFTVAFTPVPA